MIEFKAISLISCGIIVAINQTITIITNYLSDMEYRTTVTKLIQSNADKMAVAQFANTALIPYVFHMTINKDAIWSNNGLIMDIFWILIIQAIFTPLINFFNVAYIYRWLMQKSIL